MKKLRLGRRAALHGAFGTIIGLPMLECMLNESGTALAGGAALPLRYFLMHSPTSLVTSGSTSDGMVPTQTGFDYDIRPVLQPFADWEVAGDISIVSGLFAAPLDVPGGYNVDYHGQAPFAVMTGTRSGFSGESYLAQNWSADQLVVQRMAPATVHPFLYFQLDPQTEGIGVCYEQGDKAGGFSQIQAQTSPALAYQQLFTGFSPPSEEEPDPQIELERRLRLSSLGYAKDRIAALQLRLGAADRRTLDEHLTRVRELERRIEATYGGVSPNCHDPLHGDSDPPDVSTDVPDQDARAALFIELIELAFACDMSRVITLGGASAMTGTGMRHPLWNDIGGLHGEVQHTADQDDLDAANRWFVDVYARIVARFKATPEGAGNVLDNTAALFVMEGGKGLTSDPQRSGDGGGDPNHSVDNAVVLLGGRAGGLNPGQHVDLTGEDRHPSVVITTAFQAVGIEPTLGEISGVVDELFG
jgi:hypothetical protein